MPKIWLFFDLMYYGWFHLNFMREQSQPFFLRPIYFSRPNLNLFDRKEMRTVNFEHKNIICRWINVPFNALEWQIDSELIHCSPVMKVPHKPFVIPGNSCLAARFFPKPTISCQRSHCPEPKMGKIINCIFFMIRGG